MRKFTIIVLGFIFALIALFFFKAHDFYSVINTGDDKGSKKPTISQEKTTFNILLLGYGGEGHEGAYLTDTMMVVNLDTKKNKVTLISLPRDLWVKVPGKNADFHAKINSVYEMGLYSDDYPQIPEKYTDKQGAAEMVKKVVGDVTGLQIDNYIGVDFSGFKNIIDLLGGLTINVETTFDDYEYPITGKENELCGKDDQFKEVERFLADPNIPEEEKTEFFKDKEDLKKFYESITDDPVSAFPCRYEHLHFDKGTQHMDGETALKYARSRHSLQDGTDFGRAKRQQLVLEGVKDKVLSIGFLTKVIPLLDESKKYLRMDLDFDQIKKLALEAEKDSKTYKITNLVPSLQNYLKNGVSDGGQFILEPTGGEDEWGEMQTWIDQTVKGITPTPTPRPTSLTPSPAKKASE